MRREYNSRISERANRSLNRRAAVVAVEKRMIALIAAFLIVTVMILCTSISAYANSQTGSKEIHKYYTSYEIQSGDTLWTIADEYLGNSDIDKEDYIKEIRELNHLASDDHITCGQHLTVAYYSAEQK